MKMKIGDALIYKDLESSVRYDRSVFHPLVRARLDQVQARDF
jgi:hypothetical protein